MRPLLSTASSFTAPTVDKVERLLEVLAALRDDPLLGSVFVLHGGTALNVFTDELPKTRSGKIMRRLLRDVAEGRVLGDTTTLADPAVVDQIRRLSATAPTDE